MKRLLFLSVLFSLICLLSTTIAQDDDQPRLKIIYLNEDNGLLARPSMTYLIPGDSLQFISEKGAFDIMIYDAVEFLQVSDSPDLKISLDSADVSESDIYIVTEVSDDYQASCFVYCVSKGTFPTAPPRIIVQSNSGDEQ